MLKRIFQRRTGHENRRRVAEISALQSVASRRLACYRKKRWLGGQQVLEYAVFISAISAALLTMYIYTQRGLQGVIKASADQICPQSESEQFVGSDMTQSSSESITESQDKTFLNKTLGQSIVNTDSYSKTTGTSTMSSESY